MQSQIFNKKLNKTETVMKTLFILSIFLFGSIIGANASQVNDFAVKALKGGASINVKLDDVPDGTATLYVSPKGNNRNSGSKDAPFKDLQKAIDEAPEGALICVAEGNYLGKLDAGYVSIKKYVMLVGGYSEDFSERNPLKYITSIQPGPEAAATNSNYGLLDIYVKGKRDGKVLIDGFCLTGTNEQICVFKRHSLSSQRLGSGL